MALKLFLIKGVRVLHAPTRKRIGEYQTLN